jgi:signal transduction histidine kinase
MRRRLALLVAATTSLVLVAFVVPLAVLVRNVAADRAVTAATLEANSLSTVVATTDRRTLRLTLDQINATTGHHVTVFMPGTLTLGATATRSPAVKLAERGRSLSASAPGGREILVAVAGLSGGTAVIRTFVSDAELRHGVVRAWLILAGLGLVLIAVGALVADRLARSLVRPIGELARVSHRLARGELEARANPAGPAEVRDVATALNHLAGRIRELLHAERESVADISHRLRTPLTALRLDAESLTDPTEADRIGSGVDALERAVTAVIAQARQHTAETGACDAAEVVADRVRFWSVLADDTRRTVDLDLAAGPLLVGLSRADLAACVDSLLGNVFAHTPDGTGFAVLLRARTDGGARLTVADRGPGFPPPPPGEQHPLERGVSGAGSTGLGLDIARRAAQTSGGALSIGTVPGGGAQVTVDLGPAPNPEKP